MTSMRVSYFCYGAVLPAKKRLNGVRYPAKSLSFLASTHLHWVRLRLLRPFWIQCFSRTDVALSKMGKDPIDWNDKNDIHNGYLACKILEEFQLSPSSRGGTSVTDSSFSCYTLLLSGVSVSDHIELVLCRRMCSSL
jgi:hypothetical protein